jgi:hypothetical protein
MLQNARVLPVPDFPLAELAGSVEDCLGDQKHGVMSMLEKLEVKEKKTDIFNEWMLFWDSRINSVGDVLVKHQFQLPHQQTVPQKAPRKALAVEVYSGYVK